MLLPCLNPLNKIPIALLVQTTLKDGLQGFYDLASVYFALVIDHLSLNHFAIAT